MTIRSCERVQEYAATYMIALYVICFLPPMKILSGSLAVILFLITYTVTENIIRATAVALVTGVVQAVFTYIKNKKPEVMQRVSLILTVVLGGTIILLEDQCFIMWKPAALLWLGALALAVGQIMGKNSLKSSMDKEFELPDLTWHKLTFVWIGYLLFMGITSIIVLRNSIETQWVSHKPFGSTVLMIVFVVGQGLCLSRYLPRGND